MVDPVEIARERIRQHQTEIARLNAFIEMAESLMRGSHSAPPSSLTAGPESGELSVVSVPRPYDTGRSSPTKEVLSQAEERFRQLGKPQQASEIYDWLVLHGIAIAGKNPKGNLTAKFATRKDVFSYDKDSGLWSLAEWTKGQNE